MRKGENVLGLEVQSQFHRRDGVCPVLKEWKVFVHREIRGQGLARWRAQRQERNSGGKAGTCVVSSQLFSVSRAVFPKCAH